MNLSMGETEVVLAVVANHPEGLILNIIQL